MTKPKNHRELFKSEPADADVLWLEHFLKQHPAWFTAADLCRSAGWKQNEDGKRHIRQLASASEWIASGQRGYKHLQHATADEIHRSASWMESQAKNMSRRACRLRRQAHRLVALILGATALTAQAAILTDRAQFEADHSLLNRWPFYEAPTAQRWPDGIAFIGTGVTMMGLGEITLTPGLGLQCAEPAPVAVGVDSAAAVGFDLTTTSLNGSPTNAPVEASCDYGTATVTNFAGFTAAGTWFRFCAPSDVRLTIRELDIRAARQLRITSLAIEADHLILRANDTFTSVEIATSPAGPWTTTPAELLGTTARLAAPALPSFWRLKQ